MSPAHRPISHRVPVHRSFERPPLARSRSTTSPRHLKLSSPPVTHALIHPNHPPRAIGPAQPVHGAQNRAPPSRAIHPSEPRSTVSHLATRRALAARQDGSTESTGVPLNEHVALTRLSNTPSPGTEAQGASRRRHAFHRDVRQRSDERVAAHRRHLQQPETPKSDAGQTQRPTGALQRVLRRSADKDDPRRAPSPLAPAPQKENRRQRKSSGPLSSWASRAGTRVQPGWGVAVFPRGGRVLGRGSARGTEHRSRRDKGAGPLEEDGPERRECKRKASRAKESTEGWLLELEKVEFERLVRVGLRWAWPVALVDVKQRRNHHALQINKQTNKVPHVKVDRLDASQLSCPCAPSCDPPLRAMLSVLCPVKREPIPAPLGVQDIFSDLSSCCACAQQTFRSSPRPQAPTRERRANRREEGIAKAPRSSASDSKESQQSSRGPDHRHV